jgi:hypothetical protein
MPAQYHGRSALTTEWWCLANPLRIIALKVVTHADDRYRLVATRPGTLE